jgi:low affinity Fe/Cu permease
MARHRGLSHRLEQLSARVTAWTGGSWGFGVALAIVAIWAATGPIFGFSDTWQLIINTGTTIVTFLIVFLIQRSQNKDALALQLKLNELVAAMKGASNRLIDVEDLDEQELRILHEHYRALAKLAKRDARLTESHSIEEAETRHGAKLDHR